MDVTGTPAWVAALSDPAPSPAVGDMWELSWDGTHEGVVVVASVHDDHVLGIPVTQTPAGATTIPITVAGVSVTLWPQAETGLGSFLLHRRLGSALTAERVREMRLWAVDRGDLTTLHPGAGDVDADELMHLLRDFQRRCYIEWPSAAEATLNVDATGMTPRQFHEQTGLEAGRVLELWDGHFLTPDDLDALGEYADTWTTSRTDAPSRELAAPAVKDLVLELCAAMGTTEREARNAARSAYALAARTDTVSARTSTRAADTLRVLIQDAHAS